VVSVCGSGILFVGCDCMNAEKMDRCMHLVGILFPHINDNARSKSHKKKTCFVFTV
jgi:hypothetical protein